MDMDDKPVGGGGAPGFSGSPLRKEVDYSKISLDKLLVHADWKGRKEAYERVSENPTASKTTFLAVADKVSTESNAAALDALFGAFASLVRGCSDSELDTLCGAPLVLALEKGITGRPKGAQSSQEFATLLVENGKPKEVCEALLPVLAHKTPKNRMAAAQLITALVADFGTKHFPVKEILKAMQPLFNDVNPQVRKEAVNLSCQCYKYIGGGIKGFLTDLRDVQLQELEKQFESIQVGAAPPKSIKGFEDTAAVINGGGKAGGNNRVVCAPIGSLLGDNTNNDVDDDAYELLDEAPIVSRLPKNFFKKALDKATSWQDRSEVVNESLIPLLAAPRFRAKDDYHELASMTKLYLMDPQAPLMLLGFKIIQECARGLRGAYAPHARIFLTPLFEKMKDKKTSVLEHVKTTLGKLVTYHCITFDQCMDDIDQSLQSKNPTQRLAVMNFCIRMMEQLAGTDYTRLAKNIPVLKRMVNDEKQTNREVGYTILNMLIDQFGEQSYKAVVAAMDDKQRAKMQSVLLSSRGGSNTSSALPTPMEAAGPTPSSSPAKKIPRVEDSNKGTARQRTNSACGPRVSRATMGSFGAAPEERRRSRVASARGSMALPPPTPSARSAVDGVALESTLPSKMEASNTMLGLFNGDTNVTDLLRSKEWSRRLEGLCKVRECTNTWTPAQCNQHMNALLVYLRAYPGLNDESTFQVFQAALEIIENVMSRASQPISAAAGYVLVSECTPKLCETKNRQPCHDMILAVASELGGRFVVPHLLRVVTQIHTPKLLQEGNDVLIELIQGTSDGERGGAVEGKPILSYLKNTCFDVNNIPVRNSSMRVLMALRDTMGAPTVDTYVATLPPAVRGQYDNELQKVGEAPGAPQASTTTAARSGLPPQRSGSVTKRGSTVRASTPKQKRSRPNEEPSPEKPKIPASLSASVGSLNLTQRSGSTSNASPRGSFASSGGAFAIDIPQTLKRILRRIEKGEDWRDRLDGVHQVAEYIESCGDSLPPNTVGPILKALGCRLEDANKNVVVDVIRQMSDVIRVGGADEGTHALRRLLPGVFNYLGDQKANLRDEARNLVFVGVEILGLESVLPLLQRPLGSDSYLCRQNTLEAICFGFETLPEEATLPRAGLRSLVPTVVKALMDRIQEVRVAAERVVGYIVPILGEEPFQLAVQQLKPADQQAVMPALERQIGNFPGGGAGESHLSSARNTTRADNEEYEHSPSPTPRRNSAPATPRRQGGGGGPSTPRRATVIGTGAHTPRRQSISHGPADNVRGQKEVVPPASSSSNVSQKMTTTTTPPPPTAAAAAAPPPRTASPVPTAQVPAPTSANSTHHHAEDDVDEEIYSIQEIMVGLRSASAEVAYDMCTDFMKHFKSGADCGTPEMMQVMVERLYENTRQLDEHLALGIIGCLSAMYVQTRSAQRCHTNLIFRLIGTMFDCLLAEQFSLSDTVIRSLNSMVLKMLEGCPPNDVFAALLSRLTSYSTTYLQSGRKSDLKYIQVTVKCIMRLDIEVISNDNIILSCHEYLLQHPPSAFRGLDDLPIRTVKTILQNVTKHQGNELLATAERLVGSQNLVTHFIRACIDLQEKSRQSKSNNEAQAAEASRQEQRASLSPVPGARVPAAASATPHRTTVTSMHVDPALSSSSTAGATAGGSNNGSGAELCGSPSRGKSAMSEIFSRLRNHLTSSQGMEELYEYLKSHPKEKYEEDFNHQFLRCSGAFQQYVKRKLEAKLGEDKAKPSGFTLPDKIVNYKSE